jgi:hypothetical protein
MSAVERLAILVTADGGGAIREFGRVGQSAERELGRAESRAEKLGGKMTATGAVMMSASAVMVAGMWNAGQAAAAQEQAVGGAEAVFKDHAAGMLDWAESADTAAGLSEEAALRLSTRMGGALKGLGYEQAAAAEQSIRNIQIAADLAATYGGTTADAVMALGAAYRGEFDPAEQFNLFLKQSEVDAKAVEMGLAKSTTQVDKYARAQAVTALIMEQSTDAQGQFGREADTTAGKLAIAGAKFDNLKAQVGAGFTPVMTTAGGVLSGVSDALGAADDATGGLASQLIGIASVGVGAVGALSFIAGQALKMKENFSGLPDISGKVGAMAERWGASAQTAGKLSNAVSSVGSALPIVGVAAVAGIGIWQMWAQSQAAAEQRAKDFITTLDAQTGAITENTTAKVREVFESKNQLDNINKAGVSFEQYTAAISDSTSALYDGLEVTNYLSARDSEQARTKDMVIGKLREEGGARNELLATLLEQDALDHGLLNTIQEQSSAYDDNQAALRERAVQQAISAGKTKEQAEAEISAKDAAEQYTQAVKDQLAAVKALMDPLFGAYDALTKNREAQGAATQASVDAYFAQLALTDAEKNYSANSPQVKEAADRLAEATRNLDEKNMAAARSAMDVDGAVATLSAGMRSGTVSIEQTRTKLAEWVGQGYLTQAQAQQVAEKLGLVGTKASSLPAIVHIAVQQSGADTVIGKFQEVANKIREAGRAASVVGPGVAIGAPIYFTGQGRASGGTMAPWSVYELHDTPSPEVAEVGGRTLLFTGSQGGKVTNLDRAGGSGRMTAGGAGRPLVVQVVLDGKVIGETSAKNIRVSDRSLT